MPEFKGFGSRQSGARAARRRTDRFRGTMGVDVSAGEIPGQWTGAFDEMGGAVGGREVGADWAARQRQLATMQEATARGEGPSIAGGVLQQGAERAIAAQRSAVASAAPGSRALAGRTAMGNMAQITGETAMGAANIRAQEMQMAQQNLMGTLGQGRGQDIQAQQMNDQLTQFYMQQGFSRDAAQAQANMAMQEMVAGNWRTMMQGMMTPGGDSGVGGALGGLFQGLGAVGAGLTNL